MPASIIVNYSRWLFGKEAVETGAYLKHPKSGKMDIVGFLLETWFGEINYIKGQRFASQMSAEYIGRNRTFDQPLSFLMTTSHTDTAEALQLMELNDDPTLSNDKREELIAKFLKKYGIGVSFITGVVEPKVPQSEMYFNASGEIRYRPITPTAPDWAAIEPTPVEEL